MSVVNSKHFKTGEDEDKGTTERWKITEGPDDGTAIGLVENTRVEDGELIATVNIQSGDPIMQAP